MRTYCTAQGSLLREAVTGHYWVAKTPGPVDGWLTELALAPLDGCDALWTLLMESSHRQCIHLVARTSLTGFKSVEKEELHSRSPECFWSMLRPLSGHPLLLSQPPGQLGTDPTRRVLTYTAGLVARPLVVLLTRDDSLPHQLKGRLAFERECVSMEEAAAGPLPVGWDARVPTAPLLNF